jgi:hypothetical protein
MVVTDLFGYFADNFKDRIISFQNTFYTTRIFYPHGRELYFLDYSPFILFLTSLFSLFFNYITSYNLTLISIFMLNFISMYGLVKFITKRETLALLIGTLFSISPFNYSSALGHLSMLSVFVFPLTVLTFLQKSFVYFFFSTFFFGSFGVFSLYVFLLLIFSFVFSDLIKIFGKYSFYLLSFHCFLMNCLKVHTLRICDVWYI